MAVLRYYDPYMHDIYTYGIDRRVPTGYSQTCQSNGIIDWSGTLPRNREYCRMVNRIQVDPYMPFDERSINFWNPCTYGLAAVSPRHALVCQHYRGTHNRPVEVYSFMDREGQRHEVRVSAVHLNIGPDLTLLEFDRELPRDRMKIYDRIANPFYIPAGTNLWTQDPNGKVYKSQFMHTMQGSTGTVVGYRYDVVKDGLNDGGGINGHSCIFIGDSGSPTMVQDEKGTTILVGLLYGGPCINEHTFARINAVVSARGYSLTHEKLSARPEDLNQDGVIDAQDLALLLSSWGTDDLYVDLNTDGVVDAEDMAAVLSAWGSYEMQTSPYPYPTDPNLPGNTGSKPMEPDGEDEE